MPAEPSIPPRPQLPALPMVPIRANTCWWCAVFAALAVVAPGSPVLGADGPRFELDIQPILTSAGCNSGPCHGKSRGQNGFALSLLGFDDDFDYSSIAQEARGRRVFPAAPDESLLLAKASGRLPHGGGERLKLDSAAYAVLRQWIELGMPRNTADDPKLLGIRLNIADLVLPAGGTHQLLVTAAFSDGTSRDVTAWCALVSNDPPVASVDAHGHVVAGKLPGETAIMARYRGRIATLTVSIPNPEPIPASHYAQLPRQNYIDELVWERLERMGILPSDAAPDTTFLRRAHLDLIGRLPTPDEVRHFLADASADKRATAIDRLLDRPEYADYWANKWADLLRPNPYRVGIKATLNFDHWIREGFRRNQPYDQFVRELLSAQGSSWQNGAVVLFRDRRTPDELTTVVSQLFLGIRLECARCHQHPFEVYGQNEFYSLAAYFARIGRKGPGISAPISGGEETIMLATRGTVYHPVTGTELPPRPLFGAAPEIADGEDPRAALARWITAADNPYFARVAVNRVWADLMGRGLVEPVDDMRATNPPSNARLLDALAEDFRAHGYDFKHLLRTIAGSYVYGLSSLPNETNVADTVNYSRHYRTRLRAEVLLDAVVDITGVPESFAAAPPAARAVALWTVRSESMFLDAFGRPDPNQDPPCERDSDTSIVQALHLMNSASLHAKVTSSEGLAARLAGSDRAVAEIVEELYLAVYSRLPSDAEAAAAAGLFTTDDKTARRQAAEDLLWALLNTPEFVFQD